MDGHEIERWWRRRKAEDKPTTLKKFSENSWRCLCYMYTFSLGLCVLWDKPYLWNILHCAYDYPHHVSFVTFHHLCYLLIEKLFKDVTKDIWWYYMISMAFYWSLTFTQFADNKRKDFWQMFVHHVLALMLIALSWICNIHRVGSLVLLVHDCADIFVEAAKAFKYAKMQKTCDIFFGIFTVTWIVTRLIMFPRIIYACLFQTHQPLFPAYFLFNTLLIMLLVLHMMWSYMIYQVIAQSFKTGEINGDVRSSSEDDVSDEHSGKME